MSGSVGHLRRPQCVHLAAQYRHDLTAEHIEKWRALARDTAWKDFSGKNARTAELLKLAEEVT